MRIIKMTATFGRLEGETLSLQPGLTVINLPNEGGKSTWCAFIRAMLYGIPTRERDTKTTLAEKNRYAPWSGAPMSGEMDLLWQGRAVTIRRFAKGAAPFGGFEAVDTNTGQPVPELTADTCGEQLIGVGREVFCRSAFVGQTGMSIDADPELERRIAALVSSGEEDVAFSQTEKTLRTWQNRRKHNKTGLIPRLEGELEEVRAQLQAARQAGQTLATAAERLAALEAEQETLEAEAAAQKARQDWARAEQYRAAQAEQARDEAAWTALKEEAGPIPDKDALRAGQEQLFTINTLRTQCKEAQQALQTAQDELAQARARAADPLFSQQPPDQALAQAQEDAAQAEQKPDEGGAWVGPLCFALAGAAVLAAVVAQLWLLLPVGLALAAGGALHRAARAKRRNTQAQQRQTILSRYGAASGAEIRDRAITYRDNCLLEEQAQQRAQEAQQVLTLLTDTHARQWQALLTFVHSFSPQVRDEFGVSAALSRAMTMEERLATAKVKADSSRRLVESLPPAPQSTDAPPPPTARTAQQTAAALSAVRGECAQVRSEADLARGRQAALGDPLEHQAREVALSEQLARRKEEYDAIALASEVLRQANSQLQARFSPELNRRAGEWMSTLTGGRYRELTLTREFEAQLRQATGGLPQRALFFSRGTVDQLYLAVRLAVCEMALPMQDLPPLILDDALANFDEARMALALDALAQNAQERQMLLFTCHSREQAYLSACEG